MELDTGWEKRIETFKNSVLLLKEVQYLRLDELSLLEKEGIIKRFKFTFELAWKTLKDKMEFDGLILDKISPKVVVKEAYKAKYIDKVDIWLKMIDDRNLLTHSYDFETFDKVIPLIQKEYANTINELYLSLLKSEK
jgi:nucleotidyltransferase substrate binding protein (TIGR01987 family)